MSTGRRGVGIEIAGTVLRGVVADENDPDIVVAAHEVALTSDTDVEALREGFMHLHAQLDPGPRSTRLAWFPPGATLQRLDVTGLSGPELNEVRDRLDLRHATPVTLLLDAGVRRWMLAIRWNSDAAQQLQRIAEQAGFLDATIEPSPVALHRALQREVRMVHRNASAISTWAAAYDEDVVVAAAALRAGQGEYPSMALGSLHLLPRAEVVDQNTVRADIASALARNFDPSQDPSPAEVDLGLRLGGRPFPPFPPHDLRAARRIGVALGAAYGAAGVFGRLRPVDLVTPTRPVIDTVQRPWTLERMTELAETDDRRRMSWWQRVIARLPRWRSRPHPRPHDRLARDRVVERAHD